MNKIYLGFAGKEKLRLGESLVLMKKMCDILRNLNISIDEDFMYNMDSIGKLYSILQVLLNINVCVFDTSSYNNVKSSNLIEEKYEDGDYCINLKLFSFLSERLWPAIINAYIDSLSRINKYFYFQMHISISQIIELVECENEEDALKDFEKQLSAWLSFHKLGNIEKIEKLEENNYKFILKIIY